jgi:hypothetical protein
MGRKLITCLLALMVAGFSYSQSFTYKHERNISLVKFRTFVLSEIEEPEASLRLIDIIAPAPQTNGQSAKAIVDGKRKRRFSTSLYKYEQKSEDITPEIIRTFNGLPVGNSGIPNDNNMAISNAGIVISAINSSVTIFSEDGTRLAYRTLRNMVGTQLPNLNRTYDPKVVYDPQNDRFILLFLQGSTSLDTRIIVGFTETNDPLGTWNFYAIDGNPFTGKTWSDYPIIGITEQDLYITVNILRDNESWQEGFAQSVIWQIDKTSGYAGNDSVYQDLFYDLKYENKPLWSICAVQGGLEPAGPGMHFLSVRPGDIQNDSIFLHEITNSQKSGLATHTLKVLKTQKPYGVPPSAFQPDPANVLQTNDTRVLSAIEQNGKIQYVQTTSIPETGASGIFHGFIDLSSGEVENNYISSDTFDYAYPSIAFSGDENHLNSTVITFSHSSELHFPGTSVIFHNREDGYESLYSPVQMIKSGDVSINRLLDSNERWGDYTQIQRRYNADGEVWACGSYGQQPNKNGVWIGQIRVNNELNAISSSNSLQLLPNPAALISLARLEAKKDEALSFELYDITGQNVFTMDSRFVNAGIYEFMLNTAPFRSGVYQLVAYNISREVVSKTKLMIP